MKKVSLFWNHICVLHRQELIFLNRIKDQLRLQNIDLEITCFGLGYACHMSDYLRRADAKMPDIIVSADLEVYEDARIYQRFCNALHPVTGWFALKQTEDVPKLTRDRHLLPYLAIPLVFYANKARYSAAAPLSLLAAAHPGVSLAFGGINNSAAKTVVKTVIEQHGLETAANLLSTSHISDMPIQAFHQVRTGQADIALVPSIYALRADEKTTSIFCPTDGTVAIPSYICAGTTISESVAKTVIDHLTAPDICEFYVTGGNLISCLANTPENAWLKSQKTSLQLPSWNFIKSLDPVMFYEFYCCFMPKGSVLRGNG